MIMSTLPLLFISYYYYAHVKVDLEVRIIEKQKLMLDNLSSEIELEFNQTFQRIQMVSALKNSKDEKSAFYEILQQSDFIEEVVITDAKGIVEKRVSRYLLNISDENELWFDDQMWYAFQTDDKVYGNVIFNPFGQPVMKLAVPFMENGERKGIGVVVQLQEIIGLISSLRQDHSAYLYLIDRNGRVIAHQDYSQLWRNEATAVKQPVLGVEAEIDQINWTLVMEQPKKTAFEPVNEMFTNGLMVVAIVTLFASIISIYAGLYFTKPIVMLEKAMQKFQLGKQTVDIQVNRNDEMGKLVETFNNLKKELYDKTLYLEMEKERLDIVVNGIGAGLALVTKEYQVTWMNPTLQNWLKNNDLSLPCYHLIGGGLTPCQECPITCPALESHADQIMKSLDEDGYERIYKHRVFPLSHVIPGEGEYLIFIEDITEQQQMEEKIIQTDKLSALGLMASSFAHEVNNPLTTINVYAEDLIDRISIQDEELDEVEMNFYLKKIKENTERCKKITNNLLNFSRKSIWNESYMDVREVIENSISLVEYSLKKNQINVRLDIEGNLPKIAGDGLKLMQVVVNLINNAVDAMEEEGSLTLGVWQDDENLLIKVIDTGSGIPKEMIPRIFDPFYTTKPVGKGTGLGLSVCYGIIQQFGGKIDVWSEVGNGTAMQVMIPIDGKVKGDD
jgi:signal transduction histidine kinase/HAMP domain-containing protein